MAVRAELQLGIRNFQSNLKTARRDLRRETTAMKREAGSVGAALSSGVGKMGNIPAMLGLGGGVLGFAAAAKEALQAADDIADLSQKLNENAETLQRVDFAAQQAASVGVDQISKAMLRLEANLGDVSNTEVAEALENIGISAGDLVGLSLDQKLLKMSEAFQSARENGVGLRDAMDLMGRQAGELIPLLNLSQEELQSLFDGASVQSDEAIQNMAKLNDQFDALVAKGKEGFKFGVNAVASWAQLAADIIATGSFDEAAVKAGERATEAEASLIKREQARKAQGEAVEAAREAEAAIKAEAEAAKELEKAMAEIAKIRAAMAADELDLLPPDQKIDAYKDKLQDLLENSVGNFGLNFDTSVEGLEKLVASREATQGLPATGQNSVLEAMQWLEEAKELERQIAKLQEEQAAKETTEREEELAALQKLRDEANAGAFELMDPEEQARLLRDQLSGSLGVDVNEASDIESGLKALSDEVDKARKAGDRAAEQDALERLTAAQDQVMQLDQLAGQMAPEESMAAATETAMGSVGRLYQQLFNVDPAKESAESLKKIETESQKQARLLDQILTKMDIDPAPVQFNNF